MAERTRYRFGPLERRGLIAGWRGGQIAAVAAGLAVAVAALHSRPTAASVLVAVVAVTAGVALACWPVAGRTGEEWLPTVSRWGLTGLSGGRRRVSSGPALGHTIGPASGTVHGWEPGGSRHRSSCGPFGQVELLEVPGHTGVSWIGVLHDARARTYTAVLSIRGHSFALLGAAEQGRRVAGWASVLASLARERSVVHRLQWIASALPDDGRAVSSHLAERAVLGGGSPARRSYDALLAGGGTLTCRHEVLMAVQIGVAGASARAVRAAGGGDRGAAEVLGREVSMLRRHLSEADVVVEATMGPSTLLAVLRRLGHPGPVAPTLRHASGGGGGGGGGGGSGSGGFAGNDAVWPMAVEQEWSRVRTDGTWHATYWISEWPRVDVNPDFLAPLLLGPVRRSVAVVMEPLPPSQAVRQVERARTADMADSELRRRGGFLATARRAREVDVVSRREEELADGHASFRFSGYVTVTAPTREQLDDACEMTEQDAGQCRLELRRLYGDQVRALACTLPLCRGLA